jgi:hypothetical protein
VKRAGLYVAVMAAAIIPLGVLDPGGWALLSNNEARAPVLPMALGAARAGLAVSCRGVTSEASIARIRETLTLPASAAHDRDRPEPSRRMSVVRQSAGDDQEGGSEMTKLVTGDSTRGKPRKVPQGPPRYLPEAPPATRQPM